MKPQAELPDLTTYSLHYCDLCGEPLTSVQTLAGVCRICPTLPPSLRRALHEPRRENGRRTPLKRLK
jgi:hypothetical protein